MQVVDDVIVGVWAVFWLYWLVAAADAKRARWRWGRFAVVRVAMAVLVIVLIRSKAFSGTQLTSDPWREGVGLAVLLGGLAVAVWARVSLGSNWGMPMSQKEDPELVTSGPYRRVRHPIYLGILLAMAGTAVATGWYLFAAVGLLLAYFSYSARMEEKYMTGQFPDAYPAYMQATKMLIPFVL